MTKRQRLKRDPSNQRRHKKRAWFKACANRLRDGLTDSQRKLARYRAQGMIR